VYNTESQTISATELHHFMGHYCPRYTATFTLAAIDGWLT
jgi:hypothetical protein